MPPPAGGDERAMVDAVLVHLTAFADTVGAGEGGKGGVGRRVGFTLACVSSR